MALSNSLLTDAIFTAGFLAYILGIVGLTKILYSWMRSRGLPHRVSVYYNRKVVHMLAGGVMALLTPHVFTSYVMPLIASLLLAALLYIPHRTGRLLYWFQVEDNIFEVNFCIGWGLSVAALWIVLNDPFKAVVPAMFIAFGDAVTGLVRNTVFRRRTKHWLGNLAMVAVVVPLGLLYAGFPGLAAGVVASVVERYEFPPIDDNILIVASAVAIMMLSGVATF